MDSETFCYKSDLFMILLKIFERPILLCRVNGQVKQLVIYVTLKGHRITLISQMRSPSERLKCTRRTKSMQ